MLHILCIRIIKGLVIINKAHFLFFVISLDQPIVDFKLFTLINSNEMSNYGKNLRRDKC